jgi:ABC-2 type transport system permease protein
MAETSRTAQARPLLLPRPLRNPVIVKELRSRMRGRRAFMVLTAYLVLMSGILTLVYFGVASASAGGPFGPGTRQAGKAVFGAVLAVQVVLVLFIGPAFTSSAITSEKEKQTYDLLRTTLLSARALVAGKLVSALSYVILLIVASVPLQSIAFLLGGISLFELVVSQLLILTTAVAYALIGLFLSSVMRSTLAATVGTFGVALLLTAGTPILGGLIFAVISSLLVPGTPAWPMAAVLIYAGLIGAATNLPATIIVSEAFLLAENAVLGFTNTIDGRTLYVFSPWYLYLLLHGFVAVLLFVLTVGRVRRVANQ